MLKIKYIDLYYGRSTDFRLIIKKYCNLTNNKFTS